MFLTFFLLMIPFFSVMPLESKFFPLGWFWLVSKLLLVWRWTWGKMKLSLLGRCVTFSLWLISFDAGWAICLWFTWVCHWVLCTKQPLFGIRSLRGWKRSFQARSGFICQRVVDSPCWRVPFQAFWLITFPFLLSLKLWRLDWNAFKGTSCGVQQLSVSNFHWWLGKGFAYRMC